MGRPDKIDYAGAWHHVMNQGTAKMDIFTDDMDRRRFFGFIAGLRRRFGIEVHAYVLMGSHYHLLVRSQRGELSAAMQWLDGRFARTFNDRHGRVGALFRGRYTSKLVEDERYLAWLPIYIHLNPVNDRFVSRPEDWPWSSYRQVVGLERRQPWLAAGSVGRGFSRMGYRALTESYMGGAGTTFGARNAADLWRSWTGDLSRSTLPVEVIEERVGRAFGVDPQDLQRRRPQGPAAVAARTIAIGLLVTRSDLSRADVAGRYDLRSVSSASSAAQRAKRLLADLELSERLRALGLVA